MVEASGITGFFETQWPNTDHRVLFVDLNSTKLFGATLQTFPVNLPRKVTSKSMKICNKFCSTYLSDTPYYPTSNPNRSPIKMDGVEQQAFSRI
jgi:hypothetical protein